MRVLLVEDDRRIASDVARALEASGYVVETVSDGEEAWFRGDTEDDVREVFAVRALTRRAIAAR